MQQQHRRTSSTPITDAMYGKGRKSRKPAPPKREANPRHGFSIGGQLDSETLKALGWNPLTGRPRGASRKRRPAVNPAETTTRINLATGEIARKGAK